ncbi:MAG TPA: hypothetical protein VHO25_04605 [Polyangiaceae bacterium]|nr:hypothetical protein [Polyangiaceae bacterium]
MTAWDFRYWLQENWLVIVVALAVVAIYFVVRAVRKSGGHADDPSPAAMIGEGPRFATCCCCGNLGLHQVPVVGRGWFDTRFERTRRIEGIAPRYRIDHDNSDPRRLCTLHYREHKERLLTEFDEVRVECVALNRKHWARLNAVTLDREAPAPIEAPMASARVKADSSIELEPIQGVL